MTTEGKRKLGIIVFFALVGSVVGANTEDNSDLIIGTIIAWIITGAVIGWFFASLIVDAHQPWRIASFLPFRRPTAKELFTRNQDIVAAHVARVNVGASHCDESYDLARECLRAIAEKEDGLKHQWLVRNCTNGTSELQRNGARSTYMFDRHSKRDTRTICSNVKKAIQAQREQQRAEQARQQAERQRALWNANWDLVQKFYEIAERKVSVIDEYGDENWDALPQEIATVVIKIGKRNKVQFDEKKVRDILASGGRLIGPPVYDWLAKVLEVGFREYHEKQKTRAATLTDVEALSGVDFETWIAKFLKERGYDVRGTPITGDQSLIGNYI